MAALISEDQWIILLAYPDALLEQHYGCSLGHQVLGGL